MAGSRPLQGSRTGVDRGSGGQYIVDQQHAAVPHFARPSGMDIESEPHVAPPFLAAQTGLRTGPPVTAQEVGDGTLAGLLRYHPSQQRRLVVASGEQAPPMQRHGHDEIGRASCRERV